MKILIFTEGTILTHKAGQGLGREVIVAQVNSGEPSVKDYASYVPIGNAVSKMRAWKDNGADIYYLTSRTNQIEIEAISSILKKFGFPVGQLLYRQKGQTYSDVAVKLMPDVLVEDDCESIGGASEMTSTNIPAETRKKIKTIVVKEFEGIDQLPVDLGSD